MSCGNYSRIEQEIRTSRRCFISKNIKQAFVAMDINNY